MRACFGPEALSRPAGQISKTEFQSLLALLMRLDARRYHQEVHARPMSSFEPGDRISYAGRSFDSREIENLVDSACEFWLTSGRFSARFEELLAEYLDSPHVILCNSGSSANLLAFMSLTSPLLKSDGIERGDEVITVAAGFPTTVAPIVQYGCVPVFVDIEIPTYNIDVRQLEAALSSRTKAVMLAHTMGNPFDIDAVKMFCGKHGLWLIEDNCDALGSRYNLNGEWRLTGTFGDLGTSSFYPAHHITTGEGGAVYTKTARLRKILLSLRDWGKDCWCPAGKDNTCGMRFGWSKGDLPGHYDHKFIFSHFGYNLKMTDMQAAIGCAQMEKLPEFTEARKRNFSLLKAGLAEWENELILPEATAGSDPSWFGLILTLREGSRFDRSKLVAWLEGRNIQTRMLFAGNLVRQPCFEALKERPGSFRTVGSLQRSDLAMSHSLVVGVAPLLDSSMIDYMIQSIHEFFRQGSNAS